MRRNTQGTPTFRDLGAIMETIPHLGPEDTAAFAGDLAAGQFQPDPSPK
jgi:hypothetical protein